MNAPATVEQLAPSVPNPFEVLSQWENAKRQLDYWKAEEMRLRVQYADLVKDESKIGSTQTIELANDYKAKLKIPQNYGLIKDNDAINEALDAIENRTPQGKLLAERLVKWKPELSKSEYDKLPEEDKKLFAPVVEVKEGTPTLEIVEPPKKKK